MNGHASSTVANIFSSNMCKAFISTKNPEDSQHLVPDSFDCIHSHWEMLEDCWMFHVFFTKILSFTNGLLIFAANQCLARNLGNAGYRGNAGIYLFSHLKDRLVS